ncbi:MAG: hypothetical protein AAF281_13385 [Pseudomonadota bacterium]
MTARGHGLFVLTAVVALLTAGLWLFASPTYPLQRSAIGHDGLVRWLARARVDAIQPLGLPMQADEIALRILPLYDTDLDLPETPPATAIDQAKSGTEVDIRRGVVREKIARAPTLLIAPKWMRAMRHMGLAEESLRVPVADASRPFQSLGLMAGTFRRPTPGLLEIPHAGGAFLIHAPQLFPPELAPGCTALISGAGGHLLVRCARDTGPVWLLSDPDALNNHGLSLGTNAKAATRLIVEIAEGGTVLLDTSTTLFLRSTAQPAQQRGWADLQRFFAYPLTLLWFGLGLVVLLLLWQGAIRRAPPRALFGAGPGASKDVSIAAKAQLMHRTGHIVPVFRAHMEARLRWLDQTLHGRAAPGEDPVARIRLRLARADPDRAARFAKTAQAVRAAPEGATAATLEALAAELEEETSQVLDEFVRPSRQR